MIALTPEHVDRIKRMAAAQRRTPEQVLAELVLAEWVRFATRERLKPEEW